MAKKKKVARKLKAKVVQARMAVEDATRFQAPRGKKVALDELLRRLDARWPDAHCELNHRNAFELLVATILSAQCTDVRVNATTPALFAKFPDARSMAKADAKTLEQIIKPTGFYRNKAKSILGAAQKIVAEHGGNVPDMMDALLELPGVARKTASVVLGNAFHKNEGIAVDTHVTRLSQRWGLTREIDPKKIEPQLMAMLPRERWTSFSHQTIFHGRYVCQARKPNCAECMLNDICPSVQA